MVKSLVSFTAVAGGFVSGEADTIIAGFSSGW
jgi:hypothetical protein